MTRPLAPRLLGMAVVLLFSLAVYGSFQAWRTLNPSPPLPVTAGAAAASPAAYVDNAACLGCHQKQGEQWQGSHHALAMALATPQTVRGDFNNTVFRHAGVTSRFLRRGDRFFVNTDGPDGKLADFEIKYTFGVEPLQQYLIELPGGRLQSLTIAWDVARHRWFRLQPNEKTPPGDVLHWTGRYQTANTMCITCHTTGFQKKYDAATDTFNSTWAEPNVSCQACHGPGERHVAWAALPAQSRPADPASGGKFGLMAEIGTGQPQRNVEICAPCHSRRSDLTAAPVPGQPLLDNYLPSLLSQGLYHADGQQLDEVYVYGSFRQSKMYQNGVSCSHCHNAHTGKLKLDGNAVCLQCHASQANPAFPRAAGNYDTPAHHFHPDGSPGAQCVSCHMPAKTYMGVQARPDHSLRIPRPDLTLKIGTPNACNACHTHKSAQWAAQAVADRYRPKRRQEPHFGEVFAAARSGRPEAGTALAGLIADAQLPAIVRATALQELAPDNATAMPARIAAARDADPQVRAAAPENLEGLPPGDKLSALAPLLRDPVRAVRIAAARSLSSLPPARFDAATRSAFDSALSEYVAAQNTALDMPGAQVNLATLYENTGELALAEQHYLRALMIDPDFTPARANLARLYSETARDADAEQVLVAGLARMPSIGELQYSLGLLLAHRERLPQAADALGKAAKLMPGRARVQYNLGLALQQLGRRQAAEQALLAAQRLDSRDPAIAYALTAFYAQAGQRADALRWAQQFKALAPDDARLKALQSALGFR